MLPRTIELPAELATDRSDWLALVEQDLKGAPFERRLVTHTYEGLRVQPLYTPADLPASLDASGFSGLGTMVRGSRPLGISHQGWQIRQERTESDPRTLNQALLDDCEGGAGGVLLRFDALGRSGLGLDDPKAPALAGLDGCLISSLPDLETAFRGVYLDMIAVALDSGAAFVQGAALLAAAWERAGIDPAKARGSFSADPLAVLARDGELPYALSTGLERVATLAAWTEAKFPAPASRRRGVTSVRVGTAAYHHAGATATQDLAFALASGVEYLRAMTGAGMSVDAASRQIEFSFAVGCQIFLAIAKLRAARRLWARVVEASGGGTDARRLTMHVRPSKRVLTTRDPWLNILRNTACVFAAGVAGADAIGAVPFDAPLGPPSPQARRLARNTHHVLMEECSIHRVCDPSGGSAYIETLTDQLAEKAWIIFQAIEARGGMGAALASGWIASQIDSALAPRIRNLATRKDAVLGVSEFPNAREHLPTPEKVDRAALLARARGERRGAAAAPQTRSGVVDRVLGAALAGAGMGELTALLPGDARPPARLSAPIAVHPYAEAFEHLRDAADEFARSCGHRPRVFLASMGSPAEHLPRTNFARNLFDAGGFEVVGGDGWTTPEDAAVALAASRAALAVICGSDAAYPTLVPTLASALHSAGARRVVLAGNPGGGEQVYRAAGVDRFVFVKCDVVEALESLLREEGVAL
jgi:methylmalonyl-CoA mutase